MGPGGAAVNQISDADLCTWISVATGCVLAGGRLVFLLAIAVKSLFEPDAPLPEEPE